jgi:hypothetical protein
MRQAVGLLNMANGTLRISSAIVVLFANETHIERAGALKDLKHQIDELANLW